MPVSAEREKDNLLIHCATLTGTDFIDPFFCETVNRLAATTNIRQIRLTKDSLSKKKHFSPFLLPIGVIFHMSRCGSTLLAQQLRSIDGCVVYSEPTAVNDVLMPPWENWSEESICGALKVVFQMLGHAAQGKPYVIKFRSWNTLFAETLLRLLPGVPWTFLVRDTIEIAVSALKKPPTWVRTFQSNCNPFLSLKCPIGFPQDTLEDYIAGMLAAFIANVGQIPPKGGCVVPYDELPQAAWVKLAPHFGLHLNTDDLVEMRHTASIYSKDPARKQKFLADSAIKQASASQSLRAALRRRTIPVLVRLLEQFEEG
jgi:hypothetical protein